MHIPMASNVSAGSNRLRARSIVERWSRPVVFDPEVERAKEAARRANNERMREAQRMKAAEEQRRERLRKKEDAQKRPGDPGYR